MTLILSTNIVWLGGTVTFCYCDAQHVPVEGLIRLMVCLAPWCGGTYTSARQWPVYNFVYMYNFVVFDVIIYHGCFELILESLGKIP